MLAWVGLVCGLLLVGMCAGVGRLLLGRWVADRLSLGERWALFGWTGMTLLAYVVLALGLLSLLEWRWLLGAVVLWTGLGARGFLALVAETQPGPLRWCGWRTILWVLVGVCILFAATGAVHPPGTNEYDSLTYHLAAPKLYLEAGEVYRIVHDHHTNSPFNLEMLYTIGLGLGSEAMAKSFHFATYLLLIASVAGAARRYAGREDGHAPALAAALVGTLPPIVWEAGTAYVDLGMALGMWLALVCLIEWRCADQGGHRWLWLCGLSCGTALATKALGGVALLFCLLVALATAIRRGRLDWRGLAGFALLAGLVAAPWYARSWAYTGNPVYPYAYGLFGGADWDAECAENYRQDQLRYGFGRVSEAAAHGAYRPTVFIATAESPPPGPVTRIVNRLFHKGRPPAWWGLPLVPLFATFDCAVFWERPMVIGIIGPLFLAFLPALWLRRPLGAPLALCLGFALFALVVWWFTTQLTRYLIPVLVALAIPTALGASRLSSAPGGLSRVAPVLVITGLAINVLCGFIMWSGQAPFAFGRVSREEAVRAGFEMMPLFDTVNATLTGSDRVALYGEPRGYYLEVPYLWADYGYHTLLPYGQMASPEDLLRAYRRVGVTAVLINKATARSTYDGTDPAGRLIQGLVQQRVLRPLAETREGIVYRLSTPDGVDEESTRTRGPDDDDIEGASA